MACCRLAAVEKRGQQHQYQNSKEVFDHKPADGDVARGGVQVIVVGEHAHEHDCARHGNRQTEDDSG